MSVNTIEKTNIIKYEYVNVAIKFIGPITVNVYTQYDCYNHVDYTAECPYFEARTRVQKKLDAILSLMNIIAHRYDYYSNLPKSKESSLDAKDRILKAKYLWAIESCSTEEDLCDIMNTTECTFNRQTTIDTDQGVIVVNNIRSLDGTVMEFIDPVVITLTRIISTDTHTKKYIASCPTFNVCNIWGQSKAQALAYICNTIIAKYDPNDPNATNDETPKTPEEEAIRNFKHYVKSVKQTDIFDLIDYKDVSVGMMS